MSVHEIHHSTTIEEMIGSEGVIPIFENPDLTLAAITPPETGVDPTLYMPNPGVLVQEKKKQVVGGELYIGSYITRLASHRTGIYIPDGYDPNVEMPPVVMTTPLATGGPGHNEHVATEVMNTGFPVILKSVPRYHGPTTHALSLTQDANEMHGLVNEVFNSGVIAPTESVEVYGESQGAMKGLGFVAVSEAYGKEVVNGMLVAPCYLQKAEIGKPMEIVGNAVSMGLGIVRVIRTMSHESMAELKGTLSVKDMHHHVIVVPVLMSGEAGRFLPYIGEDQEMTVQYFGKDMASRPYFSKKLIESLFKKVKVSVDDRYGHVDGIMSREVSESRHDLFASLSANALAKAS